MNIIKRFFGQDIRDLNKEINVLAADNKILRDNLVRVNEELKKIREDRDKYRKLWLSVLKRK